MFADGNIDNEIEQKSAYVYQAACYPNKPFGKVVKVKTWQGNMESIGLDVALIEITDLQGTPDDGNFRRDPTVGKDFSTINKTQKP